MRFFKLLILLAIFVFRTGLYSDNCDYKTSFLIKSNPSAIINFIYDRFKTKCYICPGNHELDMDGVPISERLENIDEVFNKIPFISATHQSHSSPSMMKPYKVIHKGGKILLIIGATFKTTSPNFKFDPYKLSTKQDIPEIVYGMIKKAKKDIGKKVDFILILSHLNFDDDQKLSDYLLKQNIQNFKILGGHDHSAMPEEKSLLKDEFYYFKNESDWGSNSIVAITLGSVTFKFLHMNDHYRYFSKNGIIAFLIYEILKEELDGVLHAGDLMPAVSLLRKSIVDFFQKIESDLTTTPLLPPLYASIHHFSIPFPYDPATHYQEQGGNWYFEYYRLNSRCFASLILRSLTNHKLQKKILDSFSIVKKSFYTLYKKSHIIKSELNPNFVFRYNFSNDQKDVMRFLNRVQIYYKTKFPDIKIFGSLIQKGFFRNKQCVQQGEIFNAIFINSLCTFKNSFTIAIILGKHLKRIISLNKNFDFGEYFYHNIDINKINEDKKYYILTNDWLNSFYKLKNVKTLNYIKKVFNHLFSGCKKACKN